ncbi:glutathione S-transferase THETA 3 [Striga asiatica]|uniref:Glutathione S-transferase THETA 3 n=1 Tax=Striga asiatica TaxID=4170 RepID=A0A5A7PWU8_STRAF|nr:glutathione S-transferase THETA 3 [Striga asiatica]
MVTSQICGNTTGINNQNQATPKRLKLRVKDVQISSVKKDWSVEEEKAFANAWLNVSLDPIVGNNQKATAMWVRIHQVWKENMGSGCKYLRSSNSLQCHWSIIHASVNNFAGHYSKLERHPQSGTNSKDLIHKALDSKADDENKSPTSEESLLNIIDDNTTPEGVVDALNKLQSTLAKQISINEKTLEMKKQNEEENIQLKRQALNREMEMKMKEQKRKGQEQIMNQDLSKLTPVARAAYEAMQTNILKEWEKDDIFENSQDYEA